MDLQKKLAFIQRRVGKNKWDKYNDLVTVNESQYSFGDDALQKKFYDNIVESYSEEEKKEIFILQIRMV